MPIGTARERDFMILKTVVGLSILTFVRGYFRALRLAAAEAAEEAKNAPGVVAAEMTSRCIDTAIAAHVAEVSA